MLIGKGKSKIAVLVDGVVEKTAKSHKVEAALLKQAARLQFLASRGFRVSEVYSASQKVLKVEYISGPSLYQLKQAGAVSEVHCLRLVGLQEQQMLAHLYIGDLNHHNLIWCDQEWVIIDCGHIRSHYSPARLQYKLKLQWEKWWK